MRQPLDTNVLVRYLSGAPAEQATAAAGFLSKAPAGGLWLTDVHVAELVWVLESSIYQVERGAIATALDAVLALPAIAVADRALLQETIDLYSQRRMDWIDAYLVATARASGAKEVVSFDHFDSKLAGLEVRRIQPTT